MVDVLIVFSQDGPIPFAWFKQILPDEKDTENMWSFQIVEQEPGWILTHIS